MADTLENLGGMPESGGNTSFKATGADKVAGIAAYLQDIQGSLESLLRSPAAAYGVYRLGNTLQKHWVDKLKEGGKYTKEQITQIDNLVKRRSGLMILAAGVGVVTSQMVKLNLELRRGSIEIGKFTSLKNLPGGVDSSMQAMLRMRQMRLEQQFEFGSTFAGKREDLYKDMYRRMSRVGTRRAREQGLEGEEARLYAENLRETLANRFTTYEMGLGLDATGFSNRLMEQFAGQGMDEVIVNQIIEQLLKASEDLKLDFSMPELAGLTARLTDQYRQAGFGMQESISNTLTLMETLNQEGLELRESQISSLAGIATQFQRFDKETLLKMFTGIRLGDMTGPGGGVNILSSLQNWVKSQVGARFGEGAELPSFMALEGGDRELVRSLAERLGLDESMVIQLNNMRDIGGALMSISDGLNEVKNSGQLFSQDPAITDKLDQINKDLTAAVSLFDKIGSLVGQAAGWTAEKLGVGELSTATLEAINLAAQVGATYFGAKWLFKGAVRTAMKTAGKVPGVVGGGVASAEQMALRSGVGRVAGGMTTATTGGAGVIGKSLRGGGKLLKWGGPIVQGVLAGIEVGERLGEGERIDEAVLKTGGGILDWWSDLASMVFDPGKKTREALLKQQIMKERSDIPERFIDETLRTKGAVDFLNNIYGGKEEVKDLSTNIEEKVEDTLSKGENVVRIILENDKGQVLAEGSVDPFADPKIQTIFRVTSTGVLGSMEG